MARIAILTASDKGARGLRADVSGDIIARMAAGAGHSITGRVILPDDRETIASTLRDWCDHALADIIMTSGGTGLTARDVTPEATQDVAEREAPGLMVALTQTGLAKTPFAALSRGVAVTRGQTLIVNLAGSPKAAQEGMDVLLPLFDHIAELLTGPVEHSPTGDA